MPLNNDNGGTGHQTNSFPQKSLPEQHLIVETHLGGMGNVHATANLVGVLNDIFDALNLSESGRGAVTTSHLDIHYDKSGRTLLEQRTFGNKCMFAEDSSAQLQIRGFIAGSEAEMCSTVRLTKQLKIGEYPTTITAEAMYNKNISENPLNSGIAITYETPYGQVSHVWNAANLEGVVTYVRGNESHDYIIPEEFSLMLESLNLASNVGNEWLQVFKDITENRAEKLVEVTPNLSKNTYIGGWKTGVRSMHRLWNLARRLGLELTDFKTIDPARQDSKSTLVQLTSKEKGEYLVSLNLHAEELQDPGVKDGIIENTAQLKIFKSGAKNRILTPCATFSVLTHISGNNEKLFYRLDLHPLSGEKLQPTVTYTFVPEGNRLVEISRKRSAITLPGLIHLAKKHADFRYQR